jgi:hypothetical protein
MTEGFYVVNCASCKRQEQKVDKCTCTVTSQHEIYDTSHYKKIQSTLCGAILLRNYIQMQTSTVACIFALIIRHENRIFLPHSILRHLILLYFS